MSEPLFCLTRDGFLATEFESRLSAKFTGDSNLRHYSCAKTACREIAEFSSSTIFLDFRESGQVESLNLLFESLRSGEFGRVDVIGMTEGNLPLDIAAEAELFSVQWLKVPIETSEWNAVSSFLSKGGRVNGHRSVPARRSLSAESMSMVTYSSQMFEMFELLERIAPRDVTLLLVGETGTGKTTLAKIVHELSPRRGQPFHNVACGALPPDLIESDLFGHSRGAFTGAERNKIGRFKAAGRGTLLLDEIDVLGPKEQVKLLRVIETGEYEPVGTTETRASEARLIVASNVDLETCVEKRQFRSDLYFRLNVLQFRLPPLRERAIDIIPLAVQFIQECCERHALKIRRVDCEFLACLKRYSWPGNLRELKNQVQRAALFNRSGRLTVDDLNETIRRGFGRGAVDDETRALTLAERVARTERQILEEELRLHDDCRTTTARSLGISRVGLYKKMKRHGMI